MGLKHKSTPLSLTEITLKNWKVRDARYSGTSDICSQDYFFFPKRNSEIEFVSYRNYKKYEKFAEGDKLVVVRGKNNQEISFETDDTRADIKYTHTGGDIPLWPMKLAQGTFNHLLAEEIMQTLPEEIKEKISSTKLVTPTPDEYMDTQLLLSIYK
ncbi:MAG: hypothetical protein PHU51_02545 [Candidatus Nanoarchaeia archaeon]|nr:hypothetical protein [Candidatus Nanoarchaeia archaeon]